MTFGYGIDATDLACKKSTVRNKHLLLTPKSPDAFPRIVPRVHLGFDVTPASHDASKHFRRRPMRPDRVQIEPARVTAGKSFSGSNTLLKKFVREYIATSATISMTFASV
jgi:hypothetical protein